MTWGINHNTISNSIEFVMTDQQESNNSDQSELTYFFSALMFYTRLPVPSNAPHSSGALSSSRKYLPLIGIIVGAIAVATFLISQLYLSMPISIALSMVATILATGAFHEDGFADSCDGLGGGWKSDQVLHIMKDSRVGTYAVVGLLSLLGIKFLALLELASASITVLVFCYITAHAFSRLCSSFVIDTYEYVQDHGSSQDKHATLIIGAMPILILAFVAFVPTVIAILVSTIVASIFANYSERRIGGYTGDILGAIQQLSEVSFYLAFLAVL